MGKLDTLINKINSYSGVKSIALKFDSTQRAWVLVKSSYTASSGTLYCIDTVGTVIASTSISGDLGNGYQKMVAVNNYCCIICGTKVMAKVNIVTLSGNSLIQNIISFNNSTARYLYLNPTIHTRNGVPHMTFSAITSVSEKGIIDLDLSTGAITKPAGRNRYNAIYYYDGGTYLDGLFWNNDEVSYYTAGYSRETTVSDSKDISSLSPRLNSTYNCQMIPLFDYSNNKNDLQYEVFGGVYEEGTFLGQFHNILGLNNYNTPSKLSLGNIVFSDDATSSKACIYSLGAISILEDGLFKLYTFNPASGNVELSIETSSKNILATRQQANAIGGSLVKVTNPKQIITFGELGNYNCTINGTNQYYSNQCVRLRDIISK